MINYNLKSKETIIDRTKYAMVYTKSKDFFKMLDKKSFMPPLVGDYIFYCLVDPLYDHVMQLEEYSQELPSYICIDVFLEKSTYYEVVGTPQEISPKDEFNEYIDRYPIPIKDKVRDKLYYNFNGSREEMYSILERWKERDDLEEITLALIDDFLIREKITYPSEVLYLLVTKNEKKFYYKLEKLIEHLGEQRAYFALRKLIKKLYKAKVDYLNGKFKKESLNFFETKIFKEVFLYDITFLYYITFNREFYTPYIFCTYFERRN